MEVTATPAFAEARDVEAVTDPEPVLSPERVALACWLSAH